MTDRLTFELEPVDTLRLANLCGQFDQHLKQIEARVGVEIFCRGNIFTVLGPQRALRAAKRLLQNLYRLSETEVLTPDLINLHLQDSGVAELEGGTDAIAFSSGLAAIDAVTDLLEPGDHVVAADNLYGGTYRLFTATTRRHGIDVTFAGAADPSAFAGACTDRTRLIFVETPTNPLMHVVDLDGAQSGEQMNRAIVTAIARATPLAVPRGGAASAVWNWSWIWTVPPVRKDFSSALTMPCWTAASRPGPAPSARVPWRCSSPSNHRTGAKWWS